MARSGELLSDLAATAQRVLLGFGLAVLVSVPLGILMGTFPAGQAVLEPVIGLLRYLPASAFIPLLIIWLGLGEPSKVALLFVGTVFFNTLMTADVVRTVPRSLIDVSYTLGAYRNEVLRKVVVPHSLPGIIDAVRVNAAAAWNFVVVAELVTRRPGSATASCAPSASCRPTGFSRSSSSSGSPALRSTSRLRLLRSRVGRWAT